MTETLRQILHRYARPDAIDVTQSEIGADLNRGRATIHGHCSRLCELGYLERVDRGRYRITDAGREVLSKRSHGLAAPFVRCPDCGRKILL
jgi:predicted transcriptional regulator